MPNGRTMTHEERLALIHRPYTAPRRLDATARWAGVQIGARGFEFTLQQGNRRYGRKHVGRDEDDGNPALDFEHD